MFDLLLLVCSLVSGMDSPNYYQRERCTRQLIILNNQYDFPKLIYSLGYNHPSPEVRRRVDKVLASYYYPFPKGVPEISYLDGRGDELWIKHFKTAFYENYCYDHEEEIPNEMPTCKIEWWSLGVSAEQQATINYVRDMFAKGYKRNHIEFVIYVMYRNAEENSTYTLPTNLTNKPSYPTSHRLLKELRRMLLP